jgi:magnesium chelatase family protein
MRPGEASLAHGGCLVLDELPEFRKSCVQALACVVRDGESRTVRKGVDATIPSKPALVVACANLCACGWLGSPRPCVCKPDAVERWTARLLELCEILGVTEIVPVQYPDLARSA